MTSEEILTHRVVYSADSGPPCNTDATDLAYSQVCWLRELAYQLAVMNERDERLKSVLSESPTMGVFPKTRSGSRFPSPLPERGSPVMESRCVHCGVRTTPPQGDPASAIGNLPLSVRAYNCLKNAGIDTVEQFIALSDYELLDIPKIGKKVLKEIRKVRADTRTTPPQTVEVEWRQNEQAGS